MIERFAPPTEDPRALLAALLDFYWRGLARAAALFSHAARSPSRNGRSIRPKDLLHSKRRKRPGAIRRSRDDDEFGLGPEREDDYFDLAFRNVTDPLGSGISSDRDCDFRAGSSSVMTKEET